MRKMKNRDTKYLDQPVASVKVEILIRLVWLRSWGMLLAMR